MRVKHLFFGHLRSGTFCALARGRGHGVAGRIEWHALMHFYDNVIIIVKQRSARPRRGSCQSNPAIPSKNKLGNCNTVKNREIVILPILALNSQKKVFDYVSKSYFF